MKATAGPVLDAYAVLAYLKDEPGAATVQGALEDAAREDRLAPMCAVNWGEVAYTVARRSGRSALQSTIALLDQLPISIVPADRTLALAAARIKAEHPISHADAYCAALAELTGGPVLTGDPDFGKLEDRIEVIWLER